MLGVLIICSLCGCSGHKPESSAIDAAGGLSPAKEIARGVTIDGVPVGGKTAAYATKLLKDRVSSEYARFVFRLETPSGSDSYHYSLTDFQAHFNIAAAIAAALKSPPGESSPLPLEIDRRLVQLHISRVADNWRIPVQEPKVRFVGTSRVITAGHGGVSVDQGAAVNAVLANLPSLINPRAVDKIPMVYSAPMVAPASVRGLADTLVSYTTTFNPGNAARTNNLLLSVRNINGTVVGPGEVFSYNDSVGPRTQITGFKDAIIYVDNRMKKDVGGGICQASSTLYNCVLLANMPIVERHAHSLPVHYVPAGRDATVAWGGDDFRFRNNTSKPIIILASTTPGGTLHESLIGDRASLPHPTAMVAIDVTPQRPYEDGFAVNSYRLVKENGILIAKDSLGMSVYHKLIGDVPH